MPSFATPLRVNSERGSRPAARAAAAGDTQTEGSSQNLRHQHRVVVRGVGPAQVERRALERVRRWQPGDSAPCSLTVQTMSSSPS